MSRNQVPPSSLSQEVADKLTSVDTPSICNALEVVSGGRTNLGFTRGSFVVADPALKPVLGFARTATIRSALPYIDPPESIKARRIAWYEHVAGHGVPVISVIQDIDESPGCGAFWGEVHSNLLRGLGVGGALTNGAVRDLGVLAKGFQILAGTISPSHSFVQIASIGGNVQVRGLEIHDGDLIHMDRHGAVVIGAHALPDLCKGIDIMAEREGILIEASRQPGFSVEVLKGAIERAEAVQWHRTSEPR